MTIRFKTFLTATTACAAMACGSFYADTLALWGFSDRSSETAAMTPDTGTVAEGVAVSRLFINDSFEFFGLSNLPAPPRDGYGFGNATNDIFLDRANFFDGSSVPDPRPTAGDYTSWGPPTTAGTGDDMTSDGNAPLAFTVTADAGQTVTIESLTFDRNGAQAGAYAVFFQLAGQNTSTTVGTGVNSNSQFVIPLAGGPFVINPGETQSFTINLNSSQLNNRLTLDSIALNGTVIPEPGSLALLGLGGLCVFRRRRRD
ncbi:MAG: PEP-CTERM sorting domain-containing protein [Planctomycetota bacterium]